MAIQKPLTTRLSEATKALFAPSGQRTTPILTPTSWSALVRYSFTGNALPNPDQILAKEARGKNYELYRGMTWKDTHIGEVLGTRTNLAMSKRWSIQPYVDSYNGEREPSKLAKEQADFISHCFIDRDPEMFETLISVGLRESLTLGFQVSELEYAYDDDTKKVYINRAFPRHQERFAFNKTDWSLEIVPESLNVSASVPADPMFFARFRNGSGAENPYGNAMCRDLYWLYFFKVDILKFWAVYLERFGAPFPLLTVPAGADADPNTKAAIQNFLETYINAQGSYIPDNMKVELLQSQRENSGYQSFIQWADDCITRKVLGQILTTGQGAGGGGSYALGQTQEGVADDIIISDCKLVQFTTNRVIQQLVVLNWGKPKEGLGYPKLMYDFENPTDVVALSTAWDKFQTMGGQIPTKFAHDKFGIPMPVEGEDVLERQQISLFGGPGGDPNNPNADPNDPDKGKGGDNPNDEPPPPDPNKEPITEYSSARRLIVNISGRPLPKWSSLKKRTRYGWARSKGALFICDDNNHPLAVEFDSKKFDRTQAMEFINLYFKDYVGNVPSNISDLARVQSTFKIIDPFEKKILALFADMLDDLPNILTTDAAAKAAIQNMVAKRLTSYLQDPLSAANRKALQFGAANIAKQVKSTVTKERFDQYVDIYLDKHPFESKAISDIVLGIESDTVNKLNARFRNALKSFADGELTEAEAIDEITSQFGELSKFKARQIAVSEVNQAANWAGTQVVKDLWGDDAEAYFLVDSFSCETCQNVAAGNPYTVAQAETLGLPHPFCNDMWSFVPKGASE